MQVTQYYLELLSLKKYAVTMKKGNESILIIVSR